LIRTNQLKKQHHDQALALSLDDVLKWRVPIKIEETGQYFYLGLICNKSAWAGKRLREIEFPVTDLRILVSIHNGISQVPNGDTILYPRDKIILVTRPEVYPKKKDAVKIPYLNHRNSY